VVVVALFILQAAQAAQAAQEGAAMVAHLEVMELPHHQQIEVGVVVVVLKEKLVVMAPLASSS
jgi:hypothetical protein